MRLIFSGKFSETRAQIETEWSFEDAIEASLWLDLSEDTQVLIDRRLHDTG